MTNYDFNNDDERLKALDELRELLWDSKVISHEQLLELGNTHRCVVKLERDMDCGLASDMAKDKLSSLICKFTAMYNNIVQLVDIDEIKTKISTNPELDKYLYLMMDWSWCNREDGRYSHDIKEAELYHWFDSINSVEHRKKDILAKLDKMPEYLKQAMTPIANFIISSLDIIIKLAKENYINKKDKSRLTDEYVEKLADYAYIFYYTYNNLSVIYRQKIIVV